MIRIVAAIAASVVLLMRPLAAHHSFASEFDSLSPVALTGTITRVEWTNPHAWLYIAVPDATGAILWTVEMSPPSGLWRRGIRPDNVVPGTTVAVRGYTAKNGTRKARGRDLTLPDGRTLSLESANAEETR